MSADSDNATGGGYVLYADVMQGVRRYPLDLFFDVYPAIEITPARDFYYALRTLGENEQIASIFYPAQHAAAIRLIEHDYGIQPG